MSDTQRDERLIRRFREAMDEVLGGKLSRDMTPEEKFDEVERVLANFTPEERARMTKISAPNSRPFVFSQPDDHATHGDGDVRTAELARELNVASEPSGIEPCYMKRLAMAVEANPDHEHCNRNVEFRPIFAGKAHESWPWEDLPEGTLHLTPGSDVASADDRVEFDVMHWGDDRNRLYFDHTLTLGLGRWCLEVSLSTCNRARPFAEREAQCLGVTSWRAGALGFEIELERYAS